MEVIDMAMEIASPIGTNQSAQTTNALSQRNREKAQEAAAEQRAAAMRAPEEVRQTIRQLRQVSQAFDKRLSFSYNEELNQMIVKVIDGSTDKIIKVLPPDELQRVHIRIREAVGLLLDETI
jgi:flagellar protein FlaG